ncbi:MAG: class F sortase [Actinomycetes bacterium]
MRTRRLLVIAASLMMVAAVAVGVAALRDNGQPARPPQPPPTETGARASTPPHAGAVGMPASRPTVIDIQRIGVHASVGSVGLTPSGAMDVPQPPHYDEPAWYRYSPTPGERGPAVIVGHVDSKHGPSVFFKLGALRIGDAISVRRADGRAAHFVVRSVRRFPKTTFPTDLVYGDTAGAELRLITCGGSFNSSSGHYRDNVIVFAALV